MTDPPQKDSDGDDRPPHINDHPPVQTVYDRIASHFTKTREFPWPTVETFLEQEDGEYGLDIGCGNGRHTELLAQSVNLAVGIDLSKTMLQEAENRAKANGFRAAFFQANAAALPFASGQFDVATYIATLHHLPTRATRVKSLNELARVLAPEGIGLVSVWSTEHERFEANAGFDTTVDWTLPDGEIVPRFYHIYDPDEFTADLSTSDLHILTHEIVRGNCYARVSTGKKTR